MRICVYKKQNDKKAVSHPISSSRIQPHARACCNTGRGMPERGVGGLVAKGRGPQIKRKKRKKKGKNTPRRHPKQPNSDRGEKASTGPCQLSAPRQPYSRPATCYALPPVPFLPSSFLSSSLLSSMIYEGSSFPQGSPPGCGFKPPLAGCPPPDPQLAAASPDSGP